MLFISQSTMSHMPFRIYVNGVSIVDHILMQSSKELSSNQSLPWPTSFPDFLYQRPRFVYLKPV